MKLNMNSFIPIIALIASLNVMAQSSSKLSGAFTHFGYSSSDEVITQSQLPMLLDELKDLGNDTIIISQIRSSKTEGCKTSPSEFGWIKGFPGKLASILDSAHSRGMKVVVGTTLSRGCGNFWQSGNTYAVEQDVYQNLSLISNNYGSHPAFLGWYISDEPGQLGSEKHNYYQRVTSALKSITPGKKVAVSPYFSEAENPSPSSVASRAIAFRNATGVDIQIWQDNIGATKLFHWSRSSYSSEQYFLALGSALGMNGLWADIEIFNYGKPLINRVNGVITGGYRPSSASRINQQLWSTRSAGKRVSWLHQWHMSEVIGPNYGYVEAPLAQGLYRGLFKIGGAQFLTSLNYGNYSWSVSPNASYPDSTGREIFDRQTGDPANPQDPAWTGIPGASGSINLTVDLGSSKDVDWIGLHTLTYPSWGIRSPTSADVFCGSTSGALTKIATITSPFTATALLTSDGEEYLLGNRSPLGRSCRFIQLRIATNGSWAFVSELEISSE